MTPTAMFGEIARFLQQDVWKNGGLKWFEDNLHFNGFITFLHSKHFCLLHTYDECNDCNAAKQTMKHPPFISKCCRGHSPASIEHVQEPCTLQETLTVVLLMIDKGQDLLGALRLISFMFEDLKGLGDPNCCKASES